MLAEIRRLITSLKLSGTHEQIAERLNAPAYEISDGVSYTVADLTRTLGPQSARQFINKLRQAANRDPLAETFYQTIVSKGVSFADADTRSLLDTFVDDGVFTSTEAQNLKKIGVKSLSEVERLLGEGVRVTADDVRAALEAEPDRTRLVVSVVRDNDLRITIIEQAMYRDQPFERPQVVTWRSGEPIPEQYHHLIRAIIEGLG